jgi:hypothetical protein
MNKLLRVLVICSIGVAFAGSPIAWAQTYTTVDYPGAVGTTLNGGPNPQGTSVGSYTLDFFVTQHGYTLTSKGVFTSFDPPGSTFTTPNSINPQGVIVGNYLDSGNVSHGFVLNGTKYTTVDAPGAVGTTLTGINPSGEMSGFTCSDPACGTFGAPTTNHSFIISKKGDYTFFDPPGAISSNASTVNPSGAVVGVYTDSGGVGHGYLRDKNGTFTTIDFPGSIFTFAGYINAEGDIVGEYIDTGGVAHSFLLSKGSFTSFDPPGAVASDASGINPSGVIVGIFFDSAGNVHGYVRTS